MMTFWKKQRGISLLEVMLSLSIIAIVLVLAAKYFFAASNNQSLNRTRSTIGLVVSAVQSLKANQADYTGIDTEKVASTELLANSGDVSSGTAIKNAWGSDIVVAPNSSNVEITTTLPTDNDCKALENSYTSSSCSGAAFSLTVGTPTTP